MLQFDIVLQKQNLGPHRDTHESMYMPSHGELLVELLARAGFKPGLIFGLDDFGEAGALLNRSQAEVLIVCGADQHLSEAFARGISQVTRAYDYKVLIVSEPIFSPLSYYLDARRNAELNHLRFLERFEPDCVLYLSRYDVAAARQRWPGLSVMPYSLADPQLFGWPPTPWAQKERLLLYLGKVKAWDFARSTPVGALRREEQLGWFIKQQRIGFAWREYGLSFRQCYQAADQFRYQLQARSGYAFHSARTLQSAIVGTIPVILLHRDELGLLSIEAPSAVPDGNLLVGIEGEFDTLVDKLTDDAFCERIQARLPELMAEGTISQGVAALAARIKSRFGAESA